jgi:D-alanine-D-alanine ligase
MTPSAKKIRILVLYGGRSGEHEVSLRSAASVIRHLDPQRFEVVPVGIDKDGRWLSQDASRTLIAAQKEPTVPLAQGTMVTLPPFPRREGGALLPLGGASGGERGIDVVFPVMHGTFSEDGTIQGLLELADVPYVGCGVLASAVGMDKEMAKRLARDAGIPIVPYVVLRSVDRWRATRVQVAAQVARELGYPCFVKPVNAGSSVGVHKVKTAAALDAALEDAFRYDTKVLIEKAIAAREIELSTLENPKFGEPPLVSVAGEITPTHEFYSYEAKYLDENGAALQIPAKLTPDQLAFAQRVAREVFVALECEGMARVDLFLDRNTNEFYFNEINTLPGFTSISMYPKMWEASGIGYSELLSRLVDLAIARHERRRGLSRSR